MPAATARTVSSATEPARGPAALVDMCITMMQIVMHEGNHSPQHPTRGAEGHSREGSPEAHQCEPSGNRAAAGTAGGPARSEEHTSELQSRPHLVCRLLLEKKKKQNARFFIKQKKNKKLT